MATNPNESVSSVCTKGRKCTKLKNHAGKCNSKGLARRFWEKSPFFLLRKDQGTVRDREEFVRSAEEEIKTKGKEAEKLLLEAEEKNREAEVELKVLESKKTQVQESLKQQEEHLKQVNEQYSKLKSLLDQKQFSRSRRQNTSTTLATITDSSSSLRYRRRQETANVLEYIHGGKQGAVLGAWDFVSAIASESDMNSFIGTYKRGKYLQNILSAAVKDYNKSEESLNQAIALKFNNFLSRRKFSILCKTQSSVFDADKELWVPRNMKCAGVNLRVPFNSISNENVDRFVKALDIGHVNEIPGVPGVTRTVTGLVFMILDLHLRLPYLYSRLTWFNDNVNHFIFQFSDDGAPETSQLSMSIGSITFWNLGERVRSREHQYLLHCVSLGEKHDVLAMLWQQHTEEMLLLESSVFTVCGKQCTLEFQPAADMSWQSWACNELNQAATYPSPFANVCKANIATMGASIGRGDNHLWHPYTMEIRNTHLDLVDKFLSGVSKNLSEESRRKKKLAFMAEKGIRQDGPPRIGLFADRMRPDPLHCEINAWQHLLDVLYIEAIQRNLFDKFIKVLSSPVNPVTNQPHTQSDSCPQSSNDSVVVPDENTDLSLSSNSQIELSLSNLGFEESAQQRYKHVLDKSEVTSFSTGDLAGCGMPHIASRIQEHYKDESKRGNKLSIRLIGDQAISLARYSYRIIDSLSLVDESPAEQIKKSALAKIAEYLRNAGVLFNQITTNKCEIDLLQEYCELYFNLFALFFPSRVNVTVWTMGYAIPYHAKMLFETYKVGYGIISLQAKESKHAGLKEELVLTNRSDNKWSQIMRSNYVRSFYLPEHQPSPPSYTSHFKSRTPPHCQDPKSCECGREKRLVGQLCCSVCESSSVVTECAQKEALTPEVIAILKPVICATCNKRFADESRLEEHIRIHKAGKYKSSAVLSNPKEMSVDTLKRELKSRGLSLTGRKEILVKRLEGVLSGESQI